MKQFCSILILSLITSLGFTTMAQDSSKVVKEKMEIEKEEKIKIKLVDQVITIVDLPRDDLLEIYNIMGVKVYNRRVKAGTNEYALTLPKGYYIIKIGKKTKKIAIK